MIVTIEVDKEQFENVVERVQRKKSEITTSISYDQKLTSDVINKRFFEGRVAVENDYNVFLNELMEMLSKCTLNWGGR